MTAPKPETWAKNPTETFPPLPPEAYRQALSFYHQCQCQEHDCTVYVECCEIDPCAKVGVCHADDLHLCRPCLASCVEVQQ